VQLRTHRLRRARRGAMLGGVARGLADRTGAPVWLIRVLWLLTLAPGGVPGLLLYVLCWIFIPKEPDYL
jgi:phage shock protein C